MREIKFRAKALDNDRWLYGSLVVIVNESLTAGKQTFILPDFVFVKPETVGQFTGRHDKSGNEIYERDIVEYRWLDEEHQEGEYYCGRIDFHYGSFRLQMSLDSYASEDLTVLGNIDDNPKLLVQRCEQQ